MNVLAADQLDLARHFAGQRQGDLEIPWSQHHRPPRLRGAVAWIECRAIRRGRGRRSHPVPRRVTSHRTLSKEPLLFHTGRFRLVGDPSDVNPPPKPKCLPG